MSWNSKSFTIALIALISAVGLSACSHFGFGAAKPPASEFGYGPRASTNGSFKVTIEEEAAYRKGRMLSTVISVKDAQGASIDGAQITVDGGMPQHGHGLPTKPRVSKDLGNGRYQIDGLKFNMGGWWELKFAIKSATTSDSVTFNIEL